MSRKGIKARLRELAGDDGDLYLIELHKIATGQNMALPDGYELLDPKDRAALFPTIKERMEAAIYLSNQVNGKPSQAIEVSGPDQAPLQLANAVKIMSDADQEKLLELLSRANAELLESGSEGSEPESRTSEDPDNKSGEEPPK